MQQLGFDSDDALVIGGAVTLSSIEHFLEEALIQRPASRSRRLKAMLDMLRWFASTQIRNVAVLAGNVVTASPISDMNPVLMALGASLTLGGAGAAPREVLIRDFFKSYRVVDMEPWEVVCGIRVPSPTDDFEFIGTFKQAKRRDDDISIVNACFQVQLQQAQNGWKIKEVHTGFGGMAPMTVRAPQAEAALQGQDWNDSIMEAGNAALSQDLALPEGVPGGMAAYRQTLVLSFFRKFYIGVCLELKTAVSQDKNLPPAPPVCDVDVTAGQTFISQDRPITHGSQLFDVPKGGLQHSHITRQVDHTPAEEPGSDVRAPVGEPVQHKAALAQCTGEALYVDDMPSSRDTLHSAFVLSEKPHARIVSIDAATAKAAPGVVRFFSSSDLSVEENTIGPVYHDEELFRSKTVTATGQPIGIIVAETQEAAERAARLVKVEYEALDPILTIEDAIKAKSFHNKFLEIQCGTLEECLTASDTIVEEGEIRMGGQEHFYLETNSAFVIPGENDELTVYNSTQTPMKTQKFAAHVCGIPYSKVVCRMKRMGGGFGGKKREPCQFHLQLLLRRTGCDVQCE